MALTVGTNSYISRVDADTYFADNLQNTSWTALTDTTKDQALVTASSQISLFVKDDCKLPLVTISASLENATAELGLYLALNPNSITSGDTSKNTKRVKAGSAEVEFFKHESGSRFPAHIMSILSNGDCINSSLSMFYGIGKSHNPTGTTTDSTFKNLDKFGKHRYNSPNRG